MSNCQFLSAPEFEELCKQKDVVIIDIREPDEYDYEHIPHAINLPLSKLKQQKIDLSDHKHKAVIFHCQSGNRTKQAQDLFEAMGLNEFYILESGLLGWKKCQGEVEKNTKAPLPIMRQVQIVIGCMVLLGIFLAYFVASNFIWVSVFFAGGLLFAGITGNCALANLLAKLPFNRRK